MDLTRSPVQTRSRTRRENRPPADSDLANSPAHSKDTRRNSKAKTTALAQQDVNILQHTSRLHRAANGEVERGLRSQVDVKTRAHSAQPCYVLVPPLRDVYPKATPTVVTNADVTTEEAPEIIDPLKHTDPLLVDKGLAPTARLETAPGSLIVSQGILLTRPRDGTPSAPPKSVHFTPPSLAASGSTEPLNLTPTTPGDPEVSAPAQDSLPVQDSLLTKVLVPAGAPVHAEVPVLVGISQKHTVLWSICLGLVRGIMLCFLWALL